MIGIDWCTPLDVARKLLGPDVAVQGNLDPHLLAAPEPLLLSRVDEVLRQAGEAPGHIFNLGHGILPHTPPAAVTRVVEYVHERTSRG